MAMPEDLVPIVTALDTLHVRGTVYVSEEQGKNLLSSFAHTSLLESVLTKKLSCRGTWKITIPMFGGVLLVRFEVPYLEKEQ